MKRPSIVSRIPTLFRIWSVLLLLTAIPLLVILACVGTIWDCVKAGIAELRYTSYFGDVADLCKMTVAAIKDGKPQ